jgi:hypothetical protein
LTELRLAGLPPGAVLSDGVRTTTIDNSGTSASLVGWDLGSLTINVPPSGIGQHEVTIQAQGFDGGQITLPTTVNADLVVPGGSGGFDLVVQTPAIPPSIVADQQSMVSRGGIETVVRNAEPARFADITPVVPASTAALVDQIAALQTQVEPAGPDESDESKAAREQLDQLNEQLANSFEPFDACPEVGAATLAWQNTPADAAFHREPSLIPYTTDVYCGGYQFAGPDRGAEDPYAGLSFVSRDFWTDLRQARSPTLIEELREEYGLPAGGGATGP